MKERQVVYWSDEWLHLMQTGWITQHIEMVDGVTLAMLVFRDEEPPRQRLLLPQYLSEMSE